jgi:hypothetical protein
LVILTHKIDTLIILTTFLKKCEKDKGGLHIGTEGVFDKKETSKNKQFKHKKKTKNCERGFLDLKTSIIFQRNKDHANMVVYLCVC